MAAAAFAVLRRVIDAVTEPILFLTLYAVWAGSAGNVALIVARRAGVADDHLFAAAASGVTSYSGTVFCLLFPAFLPMFMARMEVSPPAPPTSPPFPPL
uniref:Uncharacterized protein n=1 Tax=Leersia perrieri TaxID=77586 RepID=A0A0D9X7V4_9ORYZ